MQENIDNKMTDMSSKALEVDYTLKMLKEGKRQKPLAEKSYTQWCDISKIAIFIEWKTKNCFIRSAM